MASQHSHEKARPLERGGVLYITDAPPSLEFGIDCMHYETGDKFRGVSMVPPGLHFIYYSTGMGSRQGFFVYFEKDEVVVKSWDNKNEEISSVQLIPDSSMENLLKAVYSGQEDPYLGPYPLQQHSPWLNLTSFLSESSLQRSGLHFHTPVYPGDAEDIPSELRHENKGVLTSYFPDQARVAQFCDIKLIEKGLRDTIIKSESPYSKFISQKLTQMNIDSSILLENIVAQYFDGNWEELLAELQLSFILFMLLFSFPALQQWKVLVNIICKSERVLLSQPNFTSNFIRLFFEQLQYSPDDFFETEISSDNFLKPAFSNLFQSLDSNELHPTLDEMRKRLFVFIQKKFNLYTDDSSDDQSKAGLRSCSDTRFVLNEEDMPVVVSQEEIDCYERGHTMSVSDNFNSNHSAEPKSDDLEEKWKDIDAALEFSSKTKNLNDPNVNIFDVQPNTFPQSLNDSPEKLRFESKESMQNCIFSWRYPHLYEEMMKHNKSETGKEDLTMTAMRIIELSRETECQLDEKSEASTNRLELQNLRTEAVRFVSDEVSLW